MEARRENNVDDKQALLHSAILAPLALENMANESAPYPIPVQHRPATTDDMPVCSVCGRKFVQIPLVKNTEGKWEPMCRDCRGETHTKTPKKPRQRKLSPEEYRMLRRSQNKAHNGQKG